MSRHLGTPHNLLPPLGAAALMFLVGALAAENTNPADLAIADFEGESYGDWEVAGDAFGRGPARGTLPNQQPVLGFLGKGLVNSYLEGDGTTGSLTSPPFTIQRKYINLLVGGGHHPGETCVNLLVDGEVARTATGNDSEELTWVSWDVADLGGRTARIRIVDNHKGGWGHINVDQIVQSETREQEEVSVTELYRETWRPQSHFTARKNWHNDPNGLVFYKGWYHMFFQHNPAGINWGNMTWGHAVSRDLVHWQQVGNAIEPDRLGTIFSGSAVVDWNNTAGFQQGAEMTLVAVYTAAGGTSDASKGQPFTQCIAYSTDAGQSWTKYSGNPVLRHIAGENRDPKVVWHAPTRKWIMALYKDRNTFAFFSSPDLKQWTFLHDLDVPECIECPDFFQMALEGGKGDTRWVWTAANGRYMVGSFDGQKFTPETGPHISDWGKNFYAVQTYSDIPPADGRRIQIAWMNGGRYPGMPFNQQMSFPCELRLRRFAEGIRLCRLPVKEIDSLHKKRHSWKNKTLEPGKNLLAGVTSELFDIRAEFDLANTAGVGFTIRGEPVKYSVAEKKLTCLGRAAPLEPENNRIRLRILVDRTSLEVFANDGRVSMTSCFLPRQKNRALEVHADGGAARVTSLDVFELRSAWE